MNPAARAVTRAALIAERSVAEALAVLGVHPASFDRP
jgi:hypothetical protein